MTLPAILIATLGVSVFLTTEDASLSAVQTTVQEHQVVAIYFHRTVRCPTCRRIGALSQEAVRERFESEMERGIVKFRFVDFQDLKNATLVEANGIDSPTLVLLNVFGGEVVCHTTMPKVWQLFLKPKEFRRYVGGGVAHYLAQTKEDAENEGNRSKESNE